MVITFIFVLAGILFMIGTLIYVKDKSKLQEIKNIGKSSLKQEKKKLSNLWGIGEINNQVITINKNQHSIVVELESIEYALLQDGEKASVDRELISIAQMLKFPIQFLEVKKQIELGDMLEEIKVNTINANINTNELTILKIIKEKNIKLIKDTLKLGRIEDIEKVSQYVKLEKILKYKNEQKEFSLPSYLDYIRNLQKLDVPIIGKRILYPENFIEAHDEINRKVKTIKDDNKKIDKKITERYNQLEKNIFSNEIFFIRPARSLEDLKNEAEQQNNCVYINYSEDYAFGDTDIYFMRENIEPDKSLITIEVKNGHIRQKEQKNHGSLSEEQNKILDFWEHNIVSKVA